MDSRHHVVIIGGGYGGLTAAKRLRKANVRVTLLDKRNFHTFQPLLYQVATGGISPADICSPIRSILKKSKNTTVLMDGVVEISPRRKRVTTESGKGITYDSLIISTGVRHHYFGNDSWEQHAPGLKSIEDALYIRRKILTAFELAELETDSERQSQLLTFLIVGGGPTGVELAGAIGELSTRTLRNDFKNFDPRQARIILLERDDRILGTYSKNLSKKAARSLEKLGVTVRTGVTVKNVSGGLVDLETTTGGEQVKAATVVWAAGVKGAAPLAGLTSAGAETDLAGRLIVKPDLTVPAFPEILAIGDIAVIPGQELPGVAQVAMQMGKLSARNVIARASGMPLTAFRYRDKGTMAVIGRNAAVAEIGGMRFSGFFAWLLWLFIHLFYLIEFDNRIIVFTQWAFSYFTSKRGARLISGSGE